MAALDQVGPVTPIAVCASGSGDQPGAHPCRGRWERAELPNEWCVIDFCVGLISYITSNPVALGGWDFAPEASF